MAGQQGLPDGVHVGRAQRSQGHGELPYQQQCCKGHDIFGRKKHLKCNPHILHLSKNKPCKNNCLFVAYIKLCNQGARRCHWRGSTRSPGACKEHHQGGSVHQVILIFNPTFLIWQIFLVSMRIICNIVLFYNVLTFGNNVI